jgi:hypothetical protein
MHFVPHLQKGSLGSFQGFGIADGEKRGLVLRADDFEFDHGLF